MVLQRFSVIHLHIAVAATLIGLIGCGRSPQDTLVAASGSHSRHPTPESVSWPEPNSRNLASHVAMIRALKSIIRTTPDTNIWVGDAKARALRAQLQALPPSAPLAQLGRLKAQLADAELKLGNEEEAIRLLRDCDERHLPKLTARWSEAKKRGLFLSVKFALGVAYLRLGETQNCCKQNTADSCIMPIQGDGIHTEEEGSRRAIECFQFVLNNSDERSVMWLRSRWLLNLAHMTVGDYPERVPKNYLIPQAQFLAGEPFTKFTNVAAQKGVATFSLSGGVIADDFDDGHFVR